MRLYIEERLRRWNYKGFIFPRGRAGRAQDLPSHEQLLCINFEWKGVEKDASTIFVGTSPEFEIALYTM
jgi:poly(U)-specific endoribonuclease